MTRTNDSRQSGTPRRRARAATLDLGNDLTIRSVGAQRQQLAALLAASGDVSLQAAAIEHVDTAGLQLVAAFAGQLSAGGRELRWCEPAPKLLEAASTLGLDAALRLASPH